MVTFVGAQLGGPIVDAGAIAGVVGLIVPLIVAVATKAHAPAWVKTTANVVLVAVTGAAATFVAVGGKATLGDFVLAIVVAFAASGTSFTNLWKPNGVAGLNPVTQLPQGISAATAGFGLGGTASPGQGEEQNAA